MSKVDDLIARGAEQQSRKYRRVFIPPKPSAAWLKEHDPEMYDRIVEKTLERFEADCRAQARLAAICDKDPNVSAELTEEEFAEFREKTTGKKPWSKEGKEQCPDCLSFGHMHRRDCTRQSAIECTCLTQPGALCPKCHAAVGR